MRLPYIQTQLEVLPPLAQQGVPVFLLGDFNAPSYRDYTTEVVGTRDYVKYRGRLAGERGGRGRRLQRLVAGGAPRPASRASASRGGRRGPRSSGWNPGREGPSGPHRLHLRGRAGDGDGRPARRREAAAGGHLRREPWPSDHRAVVATFEVTPGPLPVMVAATTVVTVGEVGRRGDGVLPGGGRQVVVAPAGGAGAPPRSRPWTCPTARRPATACSTPAPLGPATSRPLLVGAGDEVRPAPPSGCRRPAPSRSSRPTRRRTRPASPSS